MTGGFRTEYQVSLYNEDGFLKQLPMMNEGRYDHGCGHYINKELELVGMITHANETIWMLAFISIRSGIFGCWRVPDILHRALN